MNDPIGDFIIRIKNASSIGKESVSVPFSKMKWAVAELLSSKGYIGAIAKKNKGNFPRYINIVLLYEKSGRPIVNDVKRISKPSRRLYIGAKEIKKFKRGFGISVISTPKGIMADMDAKQANLGGELLFSIW